MVVESSVAIFAGILAGSILLTAFGLDSVIELVSAGVLIWRLQAESSGGGLQRVDMAEPRAAWITAIGLAFLCTYVIVTSILGAVSGYHPSESVVGIVLAVVTLPMMLFLVRQKRRIADRIVSQALLADAACSTTCAYMAALPFTLALE
jgi:divalent metal cation (Fe/Co/Zn/Cd) transporter